MRLIVGDDLRTGTFYDGLRIGRANAQAYEPSARIRLRVLSEQLTRMGRDRSSGRGAAFDDPLPPRPLSSRAAAS